MSKTNLCQSTSGNRYAFEHVLSCDEIIRLAKNIITSRFHRLGELTSPSHASEFLQMQIGLLEHEVFCCIFLDQRNRVICFEKLFSGSINSATVYPREIVKRSLAHNAAALIFAHNHPSGVCEISPADQAITKRAIDALALFDIRVLDHLIVSGVDIISMAERGAL